MSSSMRLPVERNGDESSAGSVLGRSIETVARARWALPIVMVLALLAMLTNEATYQVTRRTLTHGIALTDARLEANRTLQTLTELEVAARAYTARPEAAARERFDQAAQALPHTLESALAQVAKVDPEGRIGMEGLRNAIDEHARRLRAWVDATTVGRGSSASIDDVAGRARTAELSRGFDDVLARAAAVQQTARVSLFDAFLANRGAVHALVLLSVVALALFMRQLRRSDAQRHREHERLESQIRERTAELRDLAGHLVRVREDERGHLARELHDEMGGLFTAMRLELARLRRVPDVPAAAAERIAGIDKRLTDGVALKRRIIENLRPSSLDQLGLSAALEMLCVDTAAVAGITIDARLEPVTLDQDGQLCLFRIAQESLTNALKYAQAKRVQVRLQAGSAGAATLTVSDDGKGFDPDAVHRLGRHGILGMQVRVDARGGNLQVRSAPGKGTEIVATLPALAVVEAATATAAAASARA